MAKEFLDYGGLRRFKDYFKGEVKTMLGLGESDEELSFAQDEDVDTGVIADGDAGDGIVTIKNLAYYHKKLAADTKTPGSDMNSAVLDTVADALTLKEGSESEDEKSEIYTNVEAIIEDKMKWNGEFPR